MRVILRHENKDGILFAYFPENISNGDFHRLPKEFEEIEKEYPGSPNRLVSLCDIKSFNADFASVLFLAEKRNQKDFPNRFKTAILVKNEYQLGFARMFQTFIENPKMNVKIFFDQLQALDWLRSSNPH